MKLLIQFPTLARPEKFLNCLEKYLEKASNLHELKFNINCDFYDDAMNNRVVVDKIHSLVGFNTNKDNISYAINFDDNTTKISSVNAHIQNENFDIVMVASDDMIPCAENWDAHIASNMEKYFPDLDGCLHYNDGYAGNKLITLSILGKKLYDYFGYIYHPDYKSLYCDDEFTQEVKRLNKVQYIDDVIIKHEHYSSKDNSNSGDFDFSAQKTLYYSGRDQLVFNERKRLGFPKYKITND